MNDCGVPEEEIMSFAAVPKEIVDDTEDMIVSGKVGLTPEGTVVVRYLVEDVIAVL